MAAVNDVSRDRHSVAERVSDLLKASGRGRIAAGSFLTPGEVPAVTAELHRLGAGESTWILFGGYAEAERVRLYCLPDYLERVADGDADLCAALAQDEDVGITMLKITGSGYRELSHRDVLGAVLGLGLERDALGDLLMEDTQTAVLFCSARIAGFICDNLTQAGSDTVRTVMLPYDANYQPIRHFIDIADTVASPRLDCVTAALCGFSRDVAQKAVSAGRVEVNYQTVTDNDLTIPVPCTITVHGGGVLAREKGAHGPGKYKVLEIGDPNRRGRLRLRAQKYD